MKRIYLDHAAATPLDPVVREAMTPYFGIEFGNPGGLYQEGRSAKQTLENARAQVARILFAKLEEIIFTSGGTESDNLAIYGVWEVMRQTIETPHIIISTIEHYAVLETCKVLEKKGVRISYVPVSSDGIADPNDIAKSLSPQTILVSMMYANNEIGTIQPIREIAQIIQDYRKEFKTSLPYFHTDACQATEYLDINVQNLGIDMMTLNGSKIYGPKGSGILYKRNGVKIKPIIIGGGQEFRMRGGTENVAFAVGFAQALEIANTQRANESKRLTQLRDYFISKIINLVPKVVLNGHPTRRLPNNINISILDIEGEALVLYLDEKGIAFSTGSACTSESLDPSHVILALGKPYEFAHSSMRFTLGRGTTKEDLDYVLAVLPETVKWLRAVSSITVDINASSMTHPEAFADEGLKVKARSKSYK